MTDPTWEEKRGILEATGLVLVSWAFWFLMGFMVGATLFVQGQY